MSGEETIQQNREQKIAILFSLGVIKFPWEIKTCNCNFLRDKYFSSNLIFKGLREI